MSIPPAPTSDTISYEPSREPATRATGVIGGPDYRTVRDRTPPVCSSYPVTLGGMPPGDWDEHALRFLPLVESQPDDGDPDHFVFAEVSWIAKIAASSTATSFSVQGRFRRLSWRAVRNTPPR